MNAATVHRGPDFSGEYYSEHISLGHNLLAIRAVDDISKQPYTLSPDGILAFNGQIYNTQKLVEKLQSANIALDADKLHLDTYVLYQCLLHFGPEVIDEIFGMFAIAYLDVKKEQLHIYRDSSGQKNLYYYHKDNTFIFSSEIKGILEHQSINRSVDEFAVFLATSLGYIPGEKTLFSHIRKVELGQHIMYDLKSNVLRKTFFKPKTEGYFSGDFAENIKKLVQEHLQSKDKISINLSGGLDSSILLHEAHRNGYDIDSYTTSFVIEGDEKTYNEDAMLARKLATDYKTNHTEIRITKTDYLNNFIESYASIEEPNYNISLPIYLITAKTEGIHGHAKRVTLSGDGGDEIFGGYSYYLQHNIIDSKIAAYTPFFYVVFSYIRAKIKRVPFINNLHIEERWTRMKTLAKNFARHKYAPTVLSTYIKTTVAQYLHFFYRKPGPHKNSVYTSMLIDRYCWLAAENFIRSDKLYGSQSMELRSPFAYEPFRHYVDTLIPDTEYINDVNNKLFLRKYTDAVLPAYITKKPHKTGWRAPIDIWYDQDFKNLFLRIIEDARKQGGLYIDWDKVYTRIEERDTWPGKWVHIYLSLAILSTQYKLKL